MAGPTVTAGGYASELTNLQYIQKELRNLNKTLAASQSEQVCSVDGVQQPVCHSKRQHALQGASIQLGNPLFESDQHDAATSDTTWLVPPLSRPAEQNRSSVFYTEEQGASVRTPGPPTPVPHEPDMPSICSTPQISPEGSEDVVTVVERDIDFSFLDNQNVKDLPDSYYGSLSASRFAKPSKPVRLASSKGSGLSTPNLSRASLELPSVEPPAGFQLLKGAGDDDGYFSSSAQLRYTLSPEAEAIVHRGSSGGRSETSPASLTPLCDDSQAAPSSPPLASVVSGSEALGVTQLKRRVSNDTPEASCFSSRNPSEGGAPSSVNSSRRATSLHRSAPLPLLDPTFVGVAAKNPLTSSLTCEPLWRDNPVAEQDPMVGDDEPDDEARPHMKSICDTEDLIREEAYAVSERIINSSPPSKEPSCELLQSKQQGPAELVANQNVYTHDDFRCEADAVSELILSSPPSKEASQELLEPLVEQEDVAELAGDQPVRPPNDCAFETAGCPTKRVEPSAVEKAPLCCPDHGCPKEEVEAQASFTVATSPLPVSLDSVTLPAVAEAQQDAASLDLVVDSRLGTAATADNTKALPGEDAKLADMADKIRSLSNVLNSLQVDLAQMSQTTTVPCSQAVLSPTSAGSTLKSPPSNPKPTLVEYSTPADMNSVQFCNETCDAVSQDSASEDATGLTSHGVSSTLEHLLAAAEERSSDSVESKVNQMSDPKLSACESTPIMLASIPTAESNTPSPVWLTPRSFLSPRDISINEVANSADTDGATSWHTAWETVPKHADCADDDVVIGDLTDVSAATSRAESPDTLDGNVVIDDMTNTLDGGCIAVSRDAPLNETGMDLSLTEEPMPTSTVVPSIVPANDDSMPKVSTSIIEQIVEPAPSFVQSLMAMPTPAVDDDAVKCVVDGPCQLDAPTDRKAEPALAELKACEDVHKIDCSVGETPLSPASSPHDDVDYWQASRTKLSEMSGIDMMQSSLGEDESEHPLASPQLVSSPRQVSPVAPTPQAPARAGIWARLFRKSPPNTISGDRSSANSKGGKVPSSSTSKRAIQSKSAPPSAATGAVDKMPSSKKQHESAPQKLSSKKPRNVKGGVFFRCFTCGQ